MLFLCLICFFVILGYFVLVKPHNYWKNRGISCENTKFVLGHWGPAIFLKCCPSELLKNIYDSHPTKRFVPVYQLMTPVLVLRDPELIKQITVKDFDSFSQHTEFVSKDVDPMWSNNLFGTTDIKQWRELRSILSPAYTKSKLKTMYDLVVDCAREFTDSFDKVNSITFEAKDTFLKVTNDVIATTAFGVECNTMKNPDNELYVMGKELLTFGGFSVGLKILMIFISPIFGKLLEIRLINAKITHFLRSIVRTTIATREKYGTIRPDLMHLMMEARKGKLKNDEDPIASDTEVVHRKFILTDDVLAAQAMIFYFAGFDTISTLSSFTVYELALNPDIQNRLFNEIATTFRKNDGKVSYEALYEMKYLDMVISESLRKWCPFGYLERKPIKSLKLELENETLSLDEKVICYVPVFGIHRDPNYWPEPDKFDPERFSDENKLSIKPYTYLPFGVGPRNCIANRFALMAVKTILVNFLHKFEVVRISKTAVPLKLGFPSFPDIVAANEYWLGLNPRKSF